MDVVNEAPAGPGTATPAAPTLRTLLDLPRAERRQTVEDLVVAEFRTVLLMTEEDDDPPMDVSYFDLGLTSLTITDLKQRLESMLGVELSADLLFNSPTVGRLLDHICTELLPDVFPAGVASAAENAETVSSAGSAKDALLEEALRDLF
ncbi:acyl carrier protein [Streptomyces sp. NPDC000658]|uniref:acyl carrier protein n=1 Tax=Streptomyces sp. NPDC000658 TaxID=3154266 RepID=UPI003321E08D